MANIQCSILNVQVSMKYKRLFIGASFSKITLKVSYYAFLLNIEH